MTTMLSNSLLQQNNVNRLTCHVTMKLVSEDSSCSMVWWGARAACAEVSIGQWKPRKPSMVCSMIWNLIYPEEYKDIARSFCHAVHQNFANVDVTANMSNSEGSWGPAQPAAATVSIVQPEINFNNNCCASNIHQYMRNKIVPLDQPYLSDNTCPTQATLLHKHQSIV
jgi:hypothetical protein